jgi:hypothetical protein
MTAVVDDGEDWGCEDEEEEDEVASFSVDRCALKIGQMPEAGPQGGPGERR